MRLLRALGPIAVLVAIGSAASAAQAASLGGQVLVASEAMPDPRFQETVIYLIEHDARRAFGLVVNKPGGSAPIAALLDRLGIEPGEDGDDGDGGDDVQGSITAHYGGPVEPRRGFVLHSADYAVDGTWRVSPDYALTASEDVLRDIALGRGPRRSLLLFGYCGWGPAQLEGELARGDWGVVPADPELVLGTDHESKWRRAHGGGMDIII